MRRLLVSIGVFCGLLLLAGGGLVAYLATADLRPMVERWLARETGRSIAIGQLQVDWGLRTRVVVGDLKLGNAPWGRAQRMVELGSLSAEVVLSSLLTGKPRYERLAIKGLAIVLERGPGHVGNWKMGEGSSASSSVVPKDRTQVPTLIDFVLEDGVVIYRDAEIGLELRVDASRIDIAAADESAPIRFRMRGAYNGTPAALESESDSFAVLRRAGVPYPASAKLTAAGASVTFQGTLMEPLDVEGMDGRMDARIPDLAAFLAALDAGLNIAVAANAEGRLKRAGDHWQLVDAKGVVAGSPFEGSIDLMEGARRKPDDLKLDLRFARLDADKLLPPADPKRKFAQTPLDLGKDGKVDAAIRLSAAEVSFAGFSGTALQLQAKRSAGKVDIESMSVQAFGGTLSLGGGARAVDRGTGITAAGAFDRLAIDQIARHFGADTAGVAGRAVGRFGLEGEGRTVGEVLASLRGHTITVLSEGRMPRALVEKVSTNLRFLFREKAGFSEISCFLALAEIRDGVAHLAPLRLRTGDTTVSARGRVDLARERVDLAIVTDQRGSNFLTLNIPLQVRGSLTEASVTPLSGQAPSPRHADLKALPPASRQLAESNACLK